MVRHKDEASPTPDQYQAFTDAYAFFNRNLFNSSLPHCLITMTRVDHVLGYFSADRWGSTNARGERIDEIAMNPEHFAGRPPREVLSTLVHEMVHLSQSRFGKPGQGRYHNKAWGAQMEDIGLMPSDTARPGGKRTGQSVSHYIIDDGLFEQAATDFIASGWAVPFFDVQLPSAGKTKRKVQQRKTVYVCPQCEARAWGGSALHLVCGDCLLPMHPNNPPQEPEGDE